jgi:NAD-dependent SIR2 family protein deacetylase
MDELSKEAKEMVDLVLSSSNAVALTGAGISTESGLPDYGLLVPGYGRDG